MSVVCCEKLLVCRSVEYECAYNVRECALKICQSVRTFDTIPDAGGAAGCDCNVSNGRVHEIMPA